MSKACVYLVCGGGRVDGVVCIQTGFVTRAGSRRTDVESLAEILLIDGVILASWHQLQVAAAVPCEFYKPALEHYRKDVLELL